jgi:hypothetical protein
MIGPLWEVGHGVHCKETFPPALIGAAAWPGVATRWQLTSAVPKAAGATKPLSRSSGTDQAIMTGLGLFHWKAGL